ncbi:uncharacterized protein LOC130820660 [Amaranthus tricolor]|uniref:uncharacterized protein LOC130820660 n=1 Tax=Amaranthus tricolor TaxID=29722 RepID=UPI0025910644|nr:uncharacterized protein LOC130820660 [Amaranthus tricolor]
MDFDEYEYLEKTVEETEGQLKKESNGEKKEKGYRKRDEDYREREEVEDERKRKKSRSEDDNGGERKREDREKRREKEERHRDRDRDRDRDGEREKDRERRDRDKEREKEKERRERDKEKERRDRDGEKEKEREKDKERSRRHDSQERSVEKERSRRSSSRSRRERSVEKERSRRSSSRSRRERSVEKERSRRSRSRSRRERSAEKERSTRSRSRSRLERDRELESRESRRSKAKQEPMEPEADPERDQRTVFAYQMPLKATERDVYEFFTKAGKVRDVRLIMDRNSRRSKGVGYIEFYDVMSVPMAIALSGQLLLGQPVMVKPSEAEKNLVQSTASSGSSVTGPYGPSDRKLYVGNLHFNMTEQQLRQIFEPFGPVELVQLPLDLETGHCKGFGFVQFAQVEHAKAAQSLNGKLEIAGRYIKVSCVTEHVGGQDAGTTAADFDDDEGGVALNARSRYMLMQKLDRTGTSSSITGPLGVPVLNSTASVQQPMTLPNGHIAAATPTLPSQLLPSPSTEAVGTPSECLLLKNLFDPATETDPEFDLDIKEDVGEECSKFGRVRHIYVDKHSAGHVYLRFDNKEAAMNAQQGMHMRWFARRLISAIFMQPQDYEAKFGAGA